MKDIPYPSDEPPHKETTMESKWQAEFAPADTLFAQRNEEKVFSVSEADTLAMPLWIRVQEELQESEQKCADILGSIEEGYYEVDIGGNLVFLNEALAKLIDYSPDEMKGMNNRVYMSAETAKRVYQTFNEVYRTGTPTKAFNWELITKNGQRRYVETSVSLVRDQNGEPSGFRGIARDVTERKALEKARERIINHLSHELGTPLSIIEGLFARISMALEKGETRKIKDWIERGVRSVKRLKDLKTKIDDILNGRSAREKEKILYVIESALSLLDELKDGHLKERSEDVRRSIVNRLESVYRIEDAGRESILLEVFLDEICDEAILAMSTRQLEIIREFEEGIQLEMDKKVLKKVCEGFLRNAIENTPDEGKIQVVAKSEDGMVKIDVQDSGVGITTENQNMIFGGFFHTQDTGHYATRKPYFFNAGGSGSDLLRTKVFSERFGFEVEYSSTRCRHLPSDKDECPGRISSCPFAKTRDECFSSGGSTFSLHFPLKTFSPS